jgi:hypothetical protein
VLHHREWFRFVPKSRRICTELDSSAHTELDWSAHLVRAALVVDERHEPWSACGRPEPSRCNSLASSDQMKRGARCKRDPECIRCDIQTLCAEARLRRRFWWSAQVERPGGAPRWWRQVVALCGASYVGLPMWGFRWGRQVPPPDHQMAALSSAPISEGFLVTLMPQAAMTSSFS